MRSTQIYLDGMLPQSQERYLLEVSFTTPDDADAFKLTRHTLGRVARRIGTHGGTRRNTPFSDSPSLLVRDRDVGGSADPATNQYSVSASSSA